MIPDFHFKKHFGQNFLRSEDYLDKFIKVIAPSSLDTIIEIGPGDGALTEKLISHGAEIVAIEVDSDLIDFLKNKFTVNFQIINASILEVDLKNIIENLNLNDQRKLKIVGSLPYNISKPIIKMFLEQSEDLKFSQMNFLIQKEVAEDYTESPPRAKFLYNMSRCFGQMKYEFTIPKKYFQPSPKVDGGVITFIPNRLLSDETNKYFFNFDLATKNEFIKLFKQGYMNPRKTIFNNLKHLNLKEGEFNNIGINRNSRASEISIDTWINLYNLKQNK